MPKLLQINVTANWGSTGKIAEQIGLCAMSHGWDSYIAYGRYANMSSSELIKIGSSFDVYLHYGLQRIFDIEGLCSVSVTKRLIKRIHDIHPDIVQLHNIHDHYLNYRLLFEYLNKTDIKVVWTFHDCWALTGHCFHFVTKDCNRWKSGCHDCLMRGEYPKTLCDRSSGNWHLKKALFAGNNNLSVVACSKWIANFVKQSFLAEKDCFVVYNGIDLNVFIPKDNDNSLNKSSKFRIIAVSGVWNREKGLYDIYELRKRLPDEFEITIVGLSNQQLNDLPEGITGIKRTQNLNELAALYSDSDVFINPTYADTFPTVNLEALACGTPVITYRTGGSPEAVDADTGFVVEQGDLSGIVNAIETVKNKGKDFYSAACSRRAEKHFNKDDRYEEYIRIYDGLMNM